MGRSSSLLVRGGTLVEPGSPLRRHDILVEEGVIAAVEEGVSPAGVEKVIDAHGLLVVPGLINAHTHSGQALDRGVAPNLPLDLWLIWVVYGGIEFTPDDAYVLAAAGAREMLMSGCTAVIDQVWIPLEGFGDHTEAVMTAYREVGIRAGVAPMIQDRDIFESMSELEGERTPEPFGPPVDPARLLVAMETFFDEWSDGHPRLQPMVGPSAPQRCSDELMAGLAELARRRGARFHTHVLETKPQLLATRERYGRSVVEELAALSLLNDRSSLAHGVWMDADDYETVRGSGAVIVHNPISNLRCGSGLLPLADLLARDVAVALGSDGAASNDDQNMFEVLKFAHLVHTLYGNHRRWPTAEQVWAACLHGGAAALGAELGSLRVGARADLALLSADRHVAHDTASLLASLALAEHGESVHTVVVDGEIVVEDRVVLGVDGVDLTQRARALQSRIHAARDDRAAVYERYRSYLETLDERAMAAPTSIERRAAITPAFPDDR